MNGRLQGNEADPRARSGPSKQHFKQQAPGGSFANLLLSGGLWGLDKPEQGNEEPAAGIPESTASPQQQGHAGGLNQQQESPAASSSSRPEQGDSSNQSQSRAKLKLSSASDPPNRPASDSKKQAVSQLAKDLARAPQQRQEQPARFNPFQAWSHLLQPVKTVKLAGGQQPQEQKKYKREPRAQT